MAFLNNRKVLVTGVAGFIGSSLVKCLVLEGARCIELVRDVDWLCHLVDGCGGAVCI